VQFAWDPAQAAVNLRKHSVSFEEAVTVFRDPLARIHHDPAHSDDERREIIIGQASSGRLLLVSFTERGESVRIISARATDARERQTYEENV
jgi:uncharacterized DUF497 family protein